ncbi:MAG TPA: carbohydrate porin [Bryobacteraceae bacterium]|nr:carbohydrate porin [Bryobacteraceae bacterium]
MKSIAIIFMLSLCMFAQDGQDKWYDFHGQATTITQTHGPFDAPYTGTNSLRPIREMDTSLTMTLFATFKYRNTELGFSGEVAGGTGFSGVSGIAGFPNGEIPRVAKPTPTPYVARLYLKQRVSRFTWTFGKFSAADFFDNNTYSHDPRTQFMNWSIMYSGAWDYPADTRGYTVGAVQELALGNSVLRIGSFLEPVTANGPKLDGHFTDNRGDTVEWQYGYIDGGTVRLMGFVNQANMGTYRKADQDIIATRAPGTIKYGFGLNIEQKVTADIGVFSRLGWNDGKTESWAYTEIDRTASGGVSVKGNRWHRAKDVFGAAVAVNGISGDHRAYLARGGYGFIIGDGQLPHPGPETIFETYYAWQVHKMLRISPDYQFIANPAYNRDRGPVNVFSLRLHVDL